MGGPSRSYGGRSGGATVYGYRPGGHHRGHRHVRRYGFAPFYGYYDDDYSYSCAYYRRRALATGSSYWWRRYYDCID
jgi:hypothetical protein